MKRVSGGGDIEGRGIAEKTVAFKATHTNVMMMNALPKASPDGGLERRVRVVRWNYRVPENEQILDYEEKIVESEGPGILWKMLQRAVELDRNGYPPEPEQVMFDTNSAWAVMSKASEFVREVYGETKTSVTKKGFFDAYTDWYSESYNDRERWGRNKFYQQVDGLSYVKLKRTGNEWLFHIDTIGMFPKDDAEKEDTELDW